MQQSDLSSDALHQLLNNLNQRERLLKMAQLARNQGKPEAGKQLAEACLEVMA